MENALVLCLFCAIFGKVGCYMSLTSLEVCSIKFSGESIIAFHENGPKSYDILVADVNEITFLSGESTEEPYFRFNHKNHQYEFVADDDVYGEIIVYLANNVPMQREFFEYLWEHSPSNTDVGSAADCDCEADTGTLVPGDWVDEGDLANKGDIEIRLCSYWGDVTDSQDDIDEAAEIAAWNGTFTPWDAIFAADTWDCTWFWCDQLTAITQSIYRGFEVFTETTACIIPRRLKTGIWHCQNHGCGPNHHKFKTEETELAARVKCFNCQFLFGDSCGQCHQRIGCYSCSDTVGAAFGTVRGGDDCDWQYCGKLCCQDDNSWDPPTSEPTTEVECVDHEEEPHGGGQGHTDYTFPIDACMSHDERVEQADEDSPYNVRYTLPDAWDDSCDWGGISDIFSCFGDCMNQIGYRCYFDSDDDNCVQCNQDTYDFNRGCEICKCSYYDPDNNPDDPDNACHIQTNEDGDLVPQDYFWYSNGVPCVECSRFKNCLQCKNGGDFGGGGCALCDPNSNTVSAYDDEFGVWYCAIPEDADTTDTTDTDTVDEVEDDGWPGLKCLTKCDERRGSNKYCACGCDCTNCELRPAPQDPNELDPHYCIDCHFHAGCDQCYNDNQDSTQDYFMLSKEHKCENCAEIFGTRCLFCNDWVGCAQCRPGYVLTFSECCQMWYCESSTTGRR